MRRLKFALIGLMVISSMVLSAAPGLAETSGYGGRAFEARTSRTIPGVLVRFLSEDGRTLKSTVTDRQGSYRIALQPGRYLVTAGHAGYEDYASAPGFFVVTGTGYQTGNFFLSPPRVTVAVLLRHADRANDSLTDVGKARARLLAAVMQRAGVSAIYTTDYNRTRQTVQPLAESLKLVPELYTDSNNLVNRILADHQGDVVVVAGHSNTILDVARKLGAAVPPENLLDFDNLFIVARYTSDLVNLINLQYGEASQPDRPVGASKMTTLLLVRHTEGGRAGLTRAKTLLQVARFAGVQAIFASPDRLSQETVTPLANAQSPPLPIQPLTNPQTFIDEELPRYAGKVVLVAGSNALLRNIISMTGTSPFPPLLESHYDNLLILTLPKAGIARLLNLRYHAGKTDIKVDPSSLNFGDVKIGSSITKKLTVSNTGSYSLIVSQPSPPLMSSFQWKAVNMHEIIPGGASVHEVTFTPPYEGDFRGVLSLESNAAGSATIIRLSGTGYKLEPRCREGEVRYENCWIDGRPGYREIICVDGNWQKGRCKPGHIP